MLERILHLQNANTTGNGEVIKCISDLGSSLGSFSIFVSNHPNMFFMPSSSKFLIVNISDVSVVSDYVCPGLDVIVRIDHSGLPFHCNFGRLSKVDAIFISPSLLACKFYPHEKISSTPEFVEFELILNDTPYFHRKISFTKCQQLVIPEFSFRNLSFSILSSEIERAYLSCSQGCSEFHCFPGKCEAIVTGDALFRIDGYGNSTLSHKLCRVVDVAIQPFSGTIFYGAEVLFTFDVRPVSAKTSLACHLGSMSTPMVSGPGNSASCKFQVDRQVTSSSSVGVSIGDQYLSLSHLRVFAPINVTRFTPNTAIYLQSVSIKIFVEVYDPDLKVALVLSQRPVCNLAWVYPSLLVCDFLATHLGNVSLHLSIDETLYQPAIGHIQIVPPIQIFPCHECFFYPQTTAKLVFHVRMESLRDSFSRLSVCVLQECSLFDVRSDMSVQVPLFIPFTLGSHSVDILSTDGIKLSSFSIFVQNPPEIISIQSTALSPESVLTFNIKPLQDSEGLHCFFWNGSCFSHHF